MELVMNMREQFERIYESDEWGGSGGGSMVEHTRGYVEFLRRFLKEKQIKTVVDFGCGDWQFSQYIDWTEVDYCGYDIVRSVVATNRRLFTKPNVTFHDFEGGLATLPPADLLLAKDVLQHWSNASIQAFFPHLKRYRYALITNCINANGPTENIDDVDGGSRPIDLQQPPFNLEGELVYRFTNYKPFWRIGPLRQRSWLKHVLLVRTQQT
jgi:SAM-dependent methyltransferase